MTELGPPDKSAKLSDGSAVADSSFDYAYGPDFGRWRHCYYAPIIHQHFYAPPSPDYYLRLTFGADGRLNDWKRVHK